MIEDWKYSYQTVLCEKARRLDAAWKRRYFWRGFAVGMIAALGLACLALLLSCASAPPPPIQQTPWLTPKPLTIYEFNQRPVTIRHGYIYGGDGEAQPSASDSAGLAGGDTVRVGVPVVLDYPLSPFLWSFVSMMGVSKLQQMTGGDPVLLPVTIVVRETGGRI